MFHELPPRTTTSPPTIVPVYTTEDLNSAVKRVLAGEKTRAVCAEATIPYRTLRKWVAKGKLGIFRAPSRRGSAPLLTQPAEQCLVDWIVGRQIVGQPASRKEIIYKAATISAMIAGQSVGGDWYRRFMDRHPLLAPRTSQGVSKARNSRTNDDVTLLFNSLLKAVIENRLDASRIFNMDETAFQTNKGSKRVVAVRGSKNVWHQDVAVNFHLTLVACGSASGIMVPPLFVLPGSTVKLQVLEGCTVTGTAVTTSGSGFMNSFLFFEWLRFFTASVPTSVQRPLLLIMDGCASHYCADITLEAEQLGVLLLLLPSNATHLLQPLDVAVFSTYKAKLRRLTEIYVGETGANSVDKAEAIKMASTAWLVCNMGKRIKAGFAGCSLFPLSKPRMDACVDNFIRNGTPATARMVPWLRIEEAVVNEVLVLPPSRKRIRKTVTVAGRLLTRKVLDEIARPPKKTKKTPKPRTTKKVTRAKKPKTTASPSESQQADPPAVSYHDGVVIEAVV